MPIPSQHVTPRLEIDGDQIAWIVFDDPGRKLNVLAEPVMARLSEVLAEVHAGVDRGRVSVVVIRSGKPESFLAGADVDAIAAIEDPIEARDKIRLGQAIFNEIERLSVPTVAAIHGVCVGGGVEMALACRHRVLSDSPRTRLALPEVLLGILPAWGGTTRLPRLIGLRAALDILLTGRQISAARALRIGLVDRVLPAGSFLDEVRTFARTAADLPTRAPERRRTLLARLVDGTAIGRAIVLSGAKRAVLSRTGGHYPAPLRILDLLRRNLGRSVEASLEAEAVAAGELVASSVSKNLIHVFRLREAARKNPGVCDGAIEPGDVESIVVMGAGVMGGGVAQLAAYRGVRARLRDISHDAVARALGHARDLFDAAVTRRKLSRREADRRMELISGGLDGSGLADADLVVEAVAERLDVKLTVLGEVEDGVRDDCILTTNTSSLSVDALAEALDRPDRFCGLHFFNPVHKMPLVEVVRGSRTSDPTIATAYGFALALGKVPVVTGDGPGFLVNRILAPYLNEAGHLLGEGASVQDIDAAAKAFGLPMGPLRLIDEVGIDVSAHAGGSFHEALGDRLAPAPALTALAASGRPGRKGGRGFYTYRDGKEAGVDETVYGDLGPSGHVPRKALQPRSIRRRLVVQMINEAARLLDEGVVSLASSVDLALIMGVGFPPFRGGLLRFADAHHLRAVVEHARTLQTEVGERFAPPPLLVRLAAENATFYQAFGA